MKRIKTFTIQEVEDMIKPDLEGWDGQSYVNRIKQKGKEHNILVEGYNVYTRSLRYKTFMTKGYKCVCCGRVGTFYALEWVCGPENRAHFNLYASDGTLMTKDHIIPKSRGGKNRINNLQTMCEKCNIKKGNKVK